MKKKAKTRAPLSRERIVQGAAQLVEREGLSGFSTRRLGLELGCEAMSIYHYFSGREELFDAVGESLLDDSLFASEEEDARSRVVDFAASWRDVVIRRPVCFSLLVARGLNGEGGLRFLNRLLGILANGGFSARDQARLSMMLLSYMNGALLAEISAPQTDAADGELEFLRAAAPWLGAGAREEAYFRGVEMLLGSVEDDRPKKKGKKKRKR